MGNGWTMGVSKLCWMDLFVIVKKKIESFGG